MESRSLHLQCASQDTHLPKGHKWHKSTYTWYINASEQASGTVNYTIPGGTLVGGETIRLETETIEGCTLRYGFSCYSKS